MSHRRLRGRRWSTVVAVTSAVAMAAAGAWFAAGTASAGAVTGTLYVDPNTQAAQWVAAHSGDSRAATIRDKIASQATARWLSSFDTSKVQADVKAYIDAANTKSQIPVLAVYEIPNRDCGGASAGGAPDMVQYQNWVSLFSKALGSKTVIIILETDSLALQTCLNGSTLSERNSALSKATQTIKAGNSSARVYLDGGHSAWNGASTQASRLKDAGMQYADGFYTNVSNYNSTSKEADFGRAVISELNKLGLSGKRQIIDTSRNGGASGNWCGDDKGDRRIGQYPTLATNDSNIDGYLWVKPPGEADGCKYTAGSFQPDLAYSLANGAPSPRG